MSASREPVRKQFSTLLTAALVGEGKPAMAVYDHQVGDFDGNSPAVVVASGPVLRQRRTLGPCWHTTITLYVYVFVLYADENGWTEANAEDALDAIEALIADTVLANEVAPGYWSKATYADEPTQLDGVVVGGPEYRRELIQVQVEVIE